MADNELAKALKDLPIKIQTSKKKERKIVLENVVAVLSNPGINEPIIRGICKLLPQTLPRYVDSASRSYVKDLVKAMIVYQGSLTLKHLTAMLADVATLYRSLHATRTTAAAGLFALSWTCVLVINSWKIMHDNHKAEFERLVDVQAALFAVVASARDSTKTKKAYRMLVNMWKSVKGGAEQYEEVLRRAPADAHIVVFGSYFVKFLCENKKFPLLATLRVPLLEAFIKVCVSCKSSPPEWLVLEARLFLSHVSHEEFQPLLLPAMQKAMLRSPEVILVAVGHTLSGLSLDLSQYAPDLGRTLASNLVSREEAAREAAAAACLSLARQCSDAGALENLLQQLFDLFHGAQGKLTLAAHKISVLQGAGNLSHNIVTGSSMQRLATTAADGFIKVLETEVHEKTLVQALEMMALWGAKFSNEVPQHVLDWLQKGPGLKTSTAAVRTAYIGCLSACLHGNTLVQGLELVPLLLRTVEKAAAQPTQVAVVTESLAAAVLLLRLSGADIGADRKLANLWNIVLDMDKQLFVSDKFLTLASDNALFLVLQLCERLLLDHPHRLNGKASPLHKAVVFCLAAHSPALRTRCRPVIHKLVSALGGTVLARSLLKEFSR